jgi:hypothetical protein
LELFSLEKEKVALLPGGLFVFLRGLRSGSKRESAITSWNSYPRFAYNLLSGLWSTVCSLTSARFMKQALEEIMFCDGCGAPVQLGQAFCSKCGKQIVGPVMAMQMRRGRVQGHVHLLGILWLAISAFNPLAP